MNKNTDIFIVSGHMSKSLKMTFVALENPIQKTVKTKTCGAYTTRKGMTNNIEDCKCVEGAQFVNDGNNNVCECKTNYKGFN